MTAEEMFCKLGYKQGCFSGHGFFYIKELDYDEYITIWFWLHNKTFSAVWTSRHGDVAHSITVPELQAIIKQIEELGWDK